MIPEQFKDELLARVDLTSVVSQYVQLKKVGNRLYGLCPFHEEKTPSFTVHTAKQFYYCFGCGANGDAIGFLMGFDGLKYHEAVKRLADSVGMQIPKGATPVPRRVIQRRVDAESMIELLEPELLICALVSGDYERGDVVSPEDRARFIKATGQVLRALEFVRKRQLFDYSRRQIVIEARTKQEQAEGIAA